MKLTRLKPIKASSRKLVAILIFVSFSFIFFSTPIVAQTQPDENLSQKTSLQTTQTNTKIAVDPTAKPITATVAGSLKNGQVLASFCDVPVLGSAACAVKDFFQGLFERLFELVLKVIYYFVRIIGSIFGQSSQEACTLPNSATPDPNCAQAMRQIDPLYDAGPLIAKVNLFTIADAGLNDIYTTAPKINSATYLVDDFNQNIFGVKVANAQSLGQNTFGDGLKSIWKKFQALSYIVMVVILVIIGFMVMLRRRLDPRTVVTATSALPRVVLSLILITFSFAISGLFIDFIHLSISITRTFMNDSLTGVAGNLTKFGGAGGELIWLPFFTLISKSVLQIGAIVTVFTTSAIVLIVPGPNILALLILIGAFGLDIIIRIFMFVLAVMLFWNLLQRFITIIVFTIFSPVFFLFAAVPGYEGVMSTWFKRMAAAALCFPVMLVLIYIALALVSFGTNGQVNAPPPIGETGKIFNIGVLVGVGILMFSQKVPSFVDDMFGIKPGGGSGKGSGVVGLGTVIGGPGKLGKGISTINSSAGAIKPLTTAAVQKGGLIGAIASPLHSGMRLFNDQSKSYMPSVKELREGSVQRVLKAGKLSYEQHDAAGVAAQGWKEDYKRNAVIAPGVDPDLAADSAYAQKFATSPTAPPVAPSRSNAENAADADQKVRLYHRELLSQGKNAAQIKLALRSYIDNNFEK